MRRYRKGAMDRLYVEDGESRCFGWAETASGEITIQIPGNEARVEAALEAWANSFPEDDLATHRPGRNVGHLANAWSAEIDALIEDRQQLEDLITNARFQRDQYVKGIAGEYVVGDALNTLYANGWAILHSIPIYDGRADIDHLLIGPGGVWTVNAKSHGAETIRINKDYMAVGRIRVDYIPSARYEAKAAERALAGAGIETPVRGAVVFNVPRQAEFRITAPPADVMVAWVKNAPLEFMAMPIALTEREIHEIYAVARQRTTWEPA